MISPPDDIPVKALWASLGGWFKVQSSRWGKLRDVELLNIEL
jgi:hypothetical protein